MVHGYCYKPQRVCKNCVNGPTAPSACQPVPITTALKVSANDPPYDKVYWQGLLHHAVIFFSRSYWCCVTSSSSRQLVVLNWSPCLLVLIRLDCWWSNDSNCNTPHHLPWTCKYTIICYAVTSLIAYSFTIYLKVGWKSQNVPMNLTISSQDDDHAVNIVIFSSSSCLCCHLPLRRC